MYEGIETLQEKIHQICYAFYRYEIKSGLSQLESLSTEFTAFLKNKEVSEDWLQELNQLLELVVLAVERKDFLIAADLLKHELLGRMTQVAGSSA